MTQELTKNLKAIVMRTGVILWIEAERADALEAIVKAGNGHRFVEIDGQIINTADITGVHTAAAMEELTRRKNGEWQCQNFHWHGKREVCECAKEIRRKTDEQRRQREQDENNRPLTEAERAKQRENLAKMRSNLEARGILTKKMTVETEQTV